MFSTVVALKKFLFFLGTSVALLTTGVLYNSDFKSKYNYFLIKAINKTGDESRFSNSSKSNNFLCKFNKDSENTKNKHKTDKCAIFNLNEDSKKNHLFDVTNFSENDLHIEEYSKIKSNDFYLLKILGKDLETINPDENKVSIVSKEQENSYYDFSIVANFERDYRDISGNFLFGTIVDLASTDPAIALAANTKYLCNGMDCDINSIEVESEKSNIKTIKWESGITKINTYSDLTAWSNEDNKRKFYILDMKDKKFTHATKPGLISVSYVGSGQDAAKHLFNFEVRGVSGVNFSHVPVRGFLIA